MFYAQPEICGRSLGGAQRICAHKFLKQCKDKTPKTESCGDENRALKSRVFTLPVKELEAIFER